MHKLCYVLSDHSVVIGDPGESAMDALTGSGGLIEPESIGREVAKHLIRTKADEEQFKAGWELFLEPHLGTPREQSVRYFMEGCAFGGLTEASALEAIAGKDKRSNCISYRIVEEADLPYHTVGNGDPTHEACTDPDCHDRYFRNAVEDSDGILRINMVKAAAIHMSSIRGVRDTSLKELDVPFMRALEVGDTAEQQRIAGLKRSLRNIPQTFDLSLYTTPETLKAAWPPALSLGRA